MAIQVANVADYAAITSALPNKAGALTVFCWFKRAAVTPDNRGFVVLGDAVDDCWQLETQASTGLFGCYSDGGGDRFGSKNVNDNAWHKLAITISGSVLKTYVDGVVDLTNGAQSTSIATPVSLRLGASSAGDAAQVGDAIYALKIWGAALTPAQIVAEGGSYAPVLATGLYDSWLLESPTALTGTKGHNFTRNGTSFATVTSPPPFVVPGISLAARHDQFADRKGADFDNANALLGAALAGADHAIDHRES